MNTKFFLSAFLIGTALFCQADKLTPASYSFKEKTVVNAARPDEAADKDFKKLTDGKYTKEGDRRTAPYVSWRHKDNGRKAPVITFKFASPVNLEEVDIFYQWGLRSHGIKDIKINAIADDGKKNLIGSIELNQPFTRPKDTSSIQRAKIKCTQQIPVSSIEVVFTATGGFLILEEIEFYGKTAAADTKK